jgi:hypothetical protein
VIDGFVHDPPPGGESHCGAARIPGNGTGPTVSPRCKIGPSAAILQYRAHKAVRISQMPEFAVQKADTDRVYRTSGMGDLRKASIFGRCSLKRQDFCWYLANSFPPV